MIPHPLPHPTPTLHRQEYPMHDVLPKNGRALRARRDVSRGHSKTTIDDVGRLSSSSKSYDRLIPPSLSPSKYPIDDVLVKNGRALRARRDVSRGELNTTIDDVERLSSSSESYEISSHTHFDCPSIQSTMSSPKMVARFARDETSLAEKSTPPSMM